MPRGRWYLKLRPTRCDAVGQQSRSERVAGIAFVADAVVSEGERAPPVDAAAAVQPMPLPGADDAHEVSSVPEAITVRSRRAPEAAGAGASMRGRAAPIA